jgi:hypothetical protein
MNAQELFARVQAAAASGESLDFRTIRDDIHAISERTTDIKERLILLRLYHTFMDLVERSGNIDPEKIDDFHRVRAQDYRLLLMKEILVGENVSVELLNAVTQREVQAGRMQEDDELRQLALKAIAEPYSTVQELQEVEQKRLSELAKPKGWKRWFGLA